jgi:hypothetical protein
MQTRLALYTPPGKRIGETAVDAMTELPGQAWVLPGLLVAVWALLWWQGSRRARLWFAFLAPPGAILVVILAVVQSLQDADAAQGCTGGPCDKDVAHFAAGVDTAQGTLLSTNAFLALAVSLPLFLITMTVEYVLLVRRQNREEAAYKRAVALERERRKTS